MPENKTPAMHPDFPRWYRAVDLEDNRDRLSRRWRGVATLGGSAGRQEIEAMIRIVLRTQMKSSADCIDRIRQFFKKEDEYFDAGDNDRELEVLCGTVLVFLMGLETNVAAESALAVTTSTLGGARALDLPMNLPELAEEALGRMAQGRRIRPDLSAGKIGDITLKFDSASATARQQFDAEGVAAAFSLAGEAAAAGVRQIAKASAQFLSQASSFIAIQDEELQILWWLFGEHSTDLDQPFEELPDHAKPLVLAKELADATQFIPGPRSAKAMLSRAGLKESVMVRVTDAVRASDAAWLARLAKSSSISPVSEPIHFAIERRIEAGDSEAWIDGWSAATGVDRQLELSALSLGNLFYRERLLATSSED